MFAFFYCICNPATLLLVVHALPIYLPGFRVAKVAQIFNVLVVNYLQLQLMLQPRATFHYVVLLKNILAFYTQIPRKMVKHSCCGLQVVK
jgi:hypothetical protein